MSIEARQTSASNDSMSGMGTSVYSANVEHKLPYPFLIALSSLYASFGILFGLISGTLPPLLRSKGFEMSQLGWMFVLFIPFGLTFLWSPVIDAIAPYKKSPKIGWIVISQLVVTVVLFITAGLQAANPILLLILGLIVALATATMDLALDALASESVDERYRPLAGAIKAGTYLSGLVIGGGVLMALSGIIGWSGLFNLVATITIIATIPILFCTKFDRKEAAKKIAMPSLLKTFSRERNMRRLLALILLNCVFSSIMGLSRIMLVDIGISLNRIGSIVGIIGPLIGLAASIIAVPLLNRLGNGRTLIICLIYGMLAMVALVAGLNFSSNLALISTVALSAASSGLFVIMCTSLLGWAKGSQPATDYATLLGLSRLSGTIFVMTSSMFVPIIGWSGYYTFIIILFPIAVTVAIALLPEVFRIKKHEDLHAANNDSSAKTP